MLRKDCEGRWSPMRPLRVRRLEVDRWCSWKGTWVRNTAMREGWKEERCGSPRWDASSIRSHKDEKRHKWQRHEQFCLDGHPRMLSSEHVLVLVKPGKLKFCNSIILPQCSDSSPGQAMLYKQIFKQKGLTAIKNIIFIALPVKN